MIAIHVWRILPLATVIILAGLSSIPQDLHDAAQVDGAGFWRRLFQVQDSKDLEEAAMIDGLSRLGAFVKVVVPISLAGVLTVVIFSFTLVTQEFVYALTFISSASEYTVSVGVPTFLVHGDVYSWGSIMAGCFIASVPIAILYNLFVDRFIAGFTVGAVK